MKNVIRIFFRRPLFAGGGRPAWIYATDDYAIESGKGVSWLQLERDGKGTRESCWGKNGRQQRPCAGIVFEFSSRCSSCHFPNLGVAAFCARQASVKSFGADCGSWTTIVCKGGCVGCASRSESWRQGQSRPTGHSKMPRRVAEVQTRGRPKGLARCRLATGSWSHEALDSLVSCANHPMLCLKIV